MKVILYSDGSSRGNPGPGGFGTVLHFTDSNGKLHTRELSQGYTCTTNNRMELLGVITGLERSYREFFIRYFRKLHLCEEHG